MSVYTRTQKFQVPVQATIQVCVCVYLYIVIQMPIHVHTQMYTIRIVDTDVRRIYL